MGEAVAWVWCWPELIGAAILVVVAIWGTWIVAEQVGYEKAIGEWERLREERDDTF